MLVVVLVVAAVVLVGMYVTWTAQRLDRLHARVDASWAALDAHLVRRAAAAEELARDALAGGAPSAAFAPLAAAAAAARRADPAALAEREAAENALSDALHEALDDADVVDRLAHQPALAARLHDLHAAIAKVVLARRFHNDAVRDTRALRSRRLVRYARLAGRARLPRFFEIDDSEVLGTEWERR